MTAKHRLRPTRTVRSVRVVVQGHGKQTVLDLGEGLSIAKGQEMVTSHRPAVTVRGGQEGNRSRWIGKVLDVMNQGQKGPLQNQSLTLSTFFRFFTSQFPLLSSEPNHPDRFVDRRSGHTLDLSRAP